MLLQSGDPETLRLWRIFVAESMRHAREVYDLLGVLLTEEDTVGESFYNPLLPVVVDELDAKGLLVEDDGALCVFPEGFENRNGEPLPLIVRKSDGGYGYPATDLATVRDRTGRLGATRLLYVVGAEQSLHLRLVFAVAALAGYLPDGRRPPSTSSFGLVLGTDGKKLASRSGGSERLVDLLTEGIERAAAAMKERSSDLSPERRPPSRTPSAIGAVKYADLSTERDARLRLRLGPHARLRGRHRALPAVRARPHPLHLPARRGGAARAGVASRSSASPRSAPSPCSCCASPRRSRPRRRPTARRSCAPTSSTWPPRSPAFYEACRVLVDGRGGAHVAPRAVRPHGEGARAGALAARHRGARADVTGAGPAPILCRAPTRTAQGDPGNMDLNGTSAIVTGGASGLGEATSRLLAERGVHVVVADLQEDKGAPLAKEIGGLFVQTDVTNTEQVIAAVEAAIEMAPLKSLVNCAGIGWATRTIGKDGDYASAHDLDLYRRVIEINLDRHLQLHPPGRHQDEPQRARRGRRARRHREHRLGGGRGRPDRAGRLLVVEGRRRRHDPARWPATWPSSASGSTPSCPGSSTRRSTARARAPRPSRASWPRTCSSRTGSGYAGEFATLAVELLTNSYMNAESIRIDAGIRMQPK